LSKNTQPNILLVDDQPINIKLLQRKLERQGMSVNVAYSGQECIESIAQQIPDLILLDVLMPDMDGLETCQLIKENPATETIPIIFITAKSAKQEKVDGLDAGAVDYITKPIDLDETLARVRTQLRLQTMFRENVELRDRLGDTRKGAAIGAITQGITHNLNNLLGVVVGYLDLIKNGYDINRSVELMDNSVNRMVSIVRQLGIIANNERLELSSIATRQLLDNSIQRFKQENTITTEIELHSEVASDSKIFANAEYFESTLGKLLLNAWESYDSDRSKQQRKVYVQARITQNHDQATLEVKVIDDGTGLDPTVKASVFEPFVTTRAAVGRGMGLTIARHTMRNLHGDVLLAERPEGGVVATLLHPL